MTGSAALQCPVKPDITVDVAVTIPKACLYEKDHLDCKYHGKRVLWLAVVASQLKKHALFKQQEWALSNNDARYNNLNSSLRLTQLGFVPRRGFSIIQAMPVDACLTVANCCRRAVTNI